jgi:hypothetical protein
MAAARAASHVVIDDRRFPGAILNPAQACSYRAWANNRLFFSAMQAESRLRTEISGSHNTGKDTIGTAVRPASRVHSVCVDAPK